MKKMVEVFRVSLYVFIYVCIWWNKKRNCGFWCFLEREKRLFDCWYDEEEEERKSIPIHNYFKLGGRLFN